MISVFSKVHENGEYVWDGVLIVERSKVVVLVQILFQARVVPSQGKEVLTLKFTMPS